MISHRFLVIALLSVVAAMPCWADESDALRTWKDNSGLYETKATLVRHDEKFVYLKKINGSVIKVPRERLSKADQEYLRAAPADPFQRKVDTTGAAVLVLVESGGKKLVSPGVVYSQEKDRRFVMANALRREINPGVATPESVSSPGKVTIQWQADDERHEADGTIVAMHSGKWIIAGAARELPPPIQLKPMIGPSESMLVKVVGYEINLSTSPPSIARVAEDGVVKKVFLTPDGAPTNFEVECANLPLLSNALVTTIDGVAIGFIAQSPRPQTSGGPRRVVATPFDFFRQLNEPQIGTLVFAPRSGDRKEIEYEFIVSVSDPFGKINSPMLLLKSIESRERARPIARPSGGVWERAIDKAVELKLAEEQPSEIVAKQILSARSVGTTLVARYKKENPGNIPNHQFYAQFAYKTADDRVVYAAPNIMTYSPRTIMSIGARKGLELPDIPGLDGRPLDMPRAEKLENGGYRLTSEYTLVEDTAPHEPGEFPTPMESKTSAVGRIFKAGEYEAVELAVTSQPPGDYTRSRSPMAFSPDGRWLFVIDGNNVLRRIDSARLQETHSLDTKAKCKDIAISKAGILIALSDRQVVWVVEPESLKVVREVAVPNARLVAGSPASCLGFAVGKVPRGDLAKSLSQALMMIDFATGKVMHQIRGAYGGDGSYHTFQVGQLAILGDLLMDMHMSDDGERLMLGGRRIDRYRIEAEHLIYEQSTRDLQNGHTTHFVLSGDGRWTAMPTGGGNGRGYGIAVFAADDLSQWKLELDNGAYPCAIGFDPAAGKIYSPNSSEMNLFDAKGEKTGTFKLSDRDVRRIIVHPEGHRFVAWSQKKITYFDLEPGRLSKAAGAE